MANKKPAAKTEKTAVKTAGKDSGKGASKDSDAAASKAPVNAKAKSKSSDSHDAALKGKGASTLKGKKSTKSKDENLDEDLLMGEEVGNEDIPDLSDFEDQGAEAEADSDADETSEGGDEGEELTAEQMLLGGLPVTISGEEEDIILTDAEGRRLCRVRDCDQIAAVEIYCRYHYLLNWKRIQAKREILAGGKLERYVDELTSRYPDKFLDVLRKDLRTEKDFMSAIAELEIDESALENDFEDEAQNYLDEVRGVTEGSGISDEEEF